MAKMNEVEGFLEDHPEFLAQYLQRKMQKAVTNYLEYNPKFLSEYLRNRPTRDLNGLSAKSNKLVKPCRLEDTVKQSKELSKVPRKLVVKNVVSTPASQNRSSSSSKLKWNDLRSKASRNAFVLHGQTEKSCSKPTKKRSHKRGICEDARLIDLARELATTEDPDKFCFSALRHVAELLNAERCSLFWMRDNAKGDGKELASRLWNITSKSTFKDVVCDAKNELVVPITVGIAGLVASTKTPINVANAYEHQNFNKTIDNKTGFETRDILCHPLILEKEDRVVGVAEVVNKKSEEPFTEKDEEVLDHFVVLCVLAIQNSRHSSQIKRLQQAATLQETLSGRIAKLWPSRSYDDVNKEVIHQISELITCERYTLAIALVDNCNIEGCLQFARSYDMLIQKSKGGLFDDDEEEASNKVDVIKLKKNDWIFSHKVIQKVIETKKMLNMGKITPFSEFKLEDAKKEFSLKSVLCVPYYDEADRLLGVLHLANKKKGFDENDEAIIESVRPYIMNGLLFANGFNSIVINKAKTDVADDIVRFHTRAFAEEVDRVINEPVPEGEKYNLYQFSFSDLPMTNDETVLGAMRMFEDLDAFNLFKIPKEKMLRWVISVRRCYRPVYYHNWRHGFNVAHTMFLMLDRLKTATMTPGISEIFTPMERFTLVVAGFCHDIDHRGTNNAFLIRAGAPLAVLYNTSTLENHHYDTCLRISSMEGNNIFEHFTEDEFKASCELMKHAILATDLALYFQRRNTFKAILEKQAAERDFSGDNRMLLMSMMMTACDLSSITKPWEVQQKMAKLVTSEFYDQGDQERKLFGTEPMPMMDRSKSDDLPNMQIGFIDGVCSMAYEMMADFCPEFSPLRDGMKDNRQRWRERAIEQGKPDPDAPKERKEDKKEYGDLWVKYWNMDPENYIWGIDPNEKPPDVVIERVVFSPKKKAKSSSAANSQIDNDNSEIKTKKRRKNKVASENASQSPKPQEAEGKSKTCRIM
ncbi:unnamed protein product [Clavelina lepadiformis]|uniref:Phosphodiesterase n=1 Tax=Clavelina lepadiformis TaxID=159417 RepID=A0ABP0G5Q4_CLALP